MTPPPGLSEEVGKAAGSTIEALKSTPIVFSLVIFNVLFMGLMTYTSINTGDRYERIVTTAFKSCAEVPK